MQSFANSKTKLANDSTVNPTRMAKHPINSLTQSSLIEPQEATLRCEVLQNAWETMLANDSALELHSDGRTLP
jgi:hypothetical protein